MIIAFAGLPRVGKDFASKILIDYAPNVVTYSFALPFKLALCDLLGWTMEDFESDKKDIVDPVYGVTMRQMMEYIGTEIMRKHIRASFPLFDKLIGENIWVKRAEHFIEENTDKTVVITDLRHTVEYEMLKARKAHTVYIERPNYPKLDTSKSYDIKTMTFDHWIVNRKEGDTEYFKKKVIDLYELIRFEKK